MKKNFAAIALLAVLSATNASAQTAWVSPVGIPAPPFGINEVAPASPNPWTSAVPGFYYVEPSNASSTDTSNPYGTPAKPRKTIPNPLSAGSVVELHGVYTTAHRSPAFSLQGTSSSPVFIRGKSSTERATATQPWAMTGTYFIVENIDFQASVQTLLVAPINRGVLRNSTVTGTITGGGMAVGGGADSIATEVLIYRNKIRDGGNINSTVDEDSHGMVIASYVDKVWILENEIYRHSGSGIQVYAGSKALEATTRHVYIGRNDIHDTRQAGVGIKQSVDVIVSENFIHDIINTSWSPAKCMGYQYAPELVWFINNHCHNAVFGIYAGSDSGLGSGTYSFAIGNTIHNIHAPGGAFNPNTAWSNAGIMLAGGVNRYVVNNSIYDVDNGIQTPGTGNITIVNNAVSAIASTGSHVYVESGTTAAASTIHHNIFGGTVRLKWGTQQVHDVSSFIATFNKGQSTIAADPQFTAPDTCNFALKATSPAIDKGTPDQVYDAFKNYYGLDIAYDGLGNRRPGGSAWDMGAFEGAAPRPPTNVRIIK
jgi:hypothetical protein